jgi:hypothetical protein
MNDVPDTKYIHRKGNVYVIRKLINDKYGYFGQYKTISHAKKVRDWLMNHNWQWVIPDKEYYKSKYIRPMYGKYIIEKCINGKSESFGTFNNLEEAIIERDLLIKCNWDYDVLESLGE